MGFEYGYARPTRTRWLSGKASSGISRTVRRLLSTSSSVPAKRNGAALCAGAVPAAWLRRAGAGTFVGPARTLSAALCGTQHPGVRTVHTGADVPHDSSPDDAPLSQAARRHDAEKPAAPQDVGVAACRSFNRPVPADHSRDRSAGKPMPWTRIVFCSGKVYFDLLEAREVNSLRTWRWSNRAALPVSHRRIRGDCAAYPIATSIVWCQEEPQNQGAWYQIQHRLQEPLGSDRRFITPGGRGAAAPASGMFKVHSNNSRHLSRPHWMSRLPRASRNAPEITRKET